MTYPEYLNLFSNQGEYRIQVNFKDSNSCVSDISMAPSEIEKLVDQSTGLFYSKMYFDDHLHEIYKYEIDPLKNIIKIKAR